MRDGLGVYTIVQVFLGIIMGTCITAFICNITHVKDSTLVDNGVAYYDSITGELVIKNLKEAVNDTE